MVVMIMPDVECSEAVRVVAMNGGSGKQLRKVFWVEFAQVVRFETDSALVSVDTLAQVKTG